jgi:hypothetical protein
VSVANATGTKGRAVEVAARLKQLGFTATSGGDISKSQTATSIKYLPGFEKQADLLRRQLGGTAAMQSDKTLKSSAPVVLILGSSFTGVLAEPVPASTTTTTASASGSSTSTTTGPVTTIKPGEVTELVGVQAGKTPEGVVCK